MSRMLLALALLGAAPVPVTITDPVVLPAEGGDRALLVRITAPARLAGRHPVILFSHGAALGRSQYAPLVEQWAREGHVVLQPDHEDAVVDGFPPATPPPALLWRTRIADLQRLSRALPAIERAMPALRGHLDPARLLAAGHSYGAHSVAALMGARVWNGTAHRFEAFDTPAIRGAMLLSPPGSGGENLSDGFRARGGYLTVDWTHLRGPMLIVVGSADQSRALTTREPDWHADIYRRSDAANLCLITLTGAKHYLGGIVDPRRTGVEDADPARLAAVRGTSARFFAGAFAGTVQRAGDYQPLGTPGTVECR